LNESLDGGTHRHSLGLHDKPIEDLPYPFTAIVGQEILKKTLLLVLVNPGMGHFLLHGDRSTGKKMVVHSIQEILPDVNVVKGCRFHCDLGKPEDLCVECKSRGVEYLESELIPTPFKFLSHSITQKELTGELDDAMVTKVGYKAYTPGLLAEVNRGFLVIENLERVPTKVIDHIVASLKTGNNKIETSGFTFVHPVNFTLVILLNTGLALPKELSEMVNLRLRVNGVMDVEQRIEILKRVIEFEAQPEEFRARFETGQNRIGARIVKAREKLQDVQLRDEGRKVVDAICEKHGLSEAVEKTLIEAARTSASMDGRSFVNPEDVVVASRFVLAHEILKEEVEEEVAEVKAVEEIKKEAELVKGFNYLVMEEKTSQAYLLFAELMDTGLPGICLTTSFPKKLAKEYNLGDSTIYWLSESKYEGVDSLNPKRLDFEVMRTVDRFIRGKDEGVVLLDGFEHLVLENGFDKVMKFVKKINDLASMQGSTIIIPMNPGAVDKQHMNVLKKEFDKVKDYVED